MQNDAMLLPEERVAGLSDELVQSIIKSDEISLQNRKYLFGQLPLSVFRNENYVICYVFYSFKDRNITLVLTDSMKDYLADSGFDPVFGARPLKRAVQREIEDRLADLILNEELSEQSKVIFDIVENSVKTQVVSM